MLGSVINIVKSFFSYMKGLTLRPLQIRNKQTADIYLYFTGNAVKLLSWIDAEACG